MITKQTAFDGINFVFENTFPIEKDKELTKKEIQAIQMVAWDYFDTLIKQAKTK